jgi:hypothetical protein
VKHIYERVTGLRCEDLIDRTDSINTKSVQSALACKCISRTSDMSYIVTMTKKPSKALTKKPSISEMGRVREESLVSSATSEILVSRCR